MGRIALTFLLFFCLHMLPSTAWAENEYSLGLGYYSLDSENSSGSTRIANLGHLKFVYSVDVSERLVFWPGYSLYLLGGAGADLGFGIDLELAYYPFTETGRINAKNSASEWVSYETIRPFVTVSFNQRSYQSVQSSYAGVGFSLGAEYQVTNKIFYYGKIGFLTLNGPLDSKVNELQVMIGVGGYIGD